MFILLAFLLQTTQSLVSLRANRFASKRRKSRKLMQKELLQEENIGELEGDPGRAGQAEVSVIEDADHANIVSSQNAKASAPALESETPF